MVFLKHECEPKTIKMKNNNPETFVWLDLKIDQVFNLFLKPKMAKWFQLLKCETLPLFPVFYHSKLSIFGFRYNNWFPSSDPFLLPFRAFSTSALSLVFVSVFCAESVLTRDWAQCPQAATRWVENRNTRLLSFHYFSCLRFCFHIHG